MISAIITAAGKNRRMREDLKSRGIEIFHKLLLDIHGTPIIIKTIQNTLDAGIDECIIVLGHFVDEITSVIDEMDDERVKIIINPEIDVELSDSLLNGINNSKHDYCLCVAADQPTVSTQTLENIMDGVFNSSVPKNTISILARGKTGYLKSAKGLGMPFSCHKNLLKKYLKEHSDNLNPILRKMVNNGVIFYGIPARNHLELVNINRYDDYLKIVNDEYSEL